MYGPSSGVTGAGAVRRDAGCGAALYAMAAVVVALAVLSFYRNGLWRDPVRLWSDGIAKAPSKSRPYLNRGLVFYRDRNFDMALPDFERAAQLAPARPLLYNNIGLAYMRLGSLDEAEAAFAKAAGAAPHLRGAAYVNLGTVWLMRGNRLAAIEWFKKAVDSNPSDAAALRNLGFVYGEVGDYGLAEAAFEKAVRSDPANASGFYGLAMAKDSLGKNAEAAALWRRFLDASAADARYGEYRSIAARRLERLERPGQ